MRSTPPPVRLHSPHAELVPMELAHAAALAGAAADDRLQGLWFTNVPSPDGMEPEIARRLALRDAGAMVPFTVLDPAGVPVGMTAFMDIDVANCRLEIGSTWYAPRVQRTALNTACKLMLLQHAFEVLGCVAVEFRTHILNTASRRAIERLGAKLDGILRNHRRMPNGTLRDTAVYSIIATEWPTVRAHLTWQLERPRSV